MPAPCAFFSHKPPFIAELPTALPAGDDFSGVDTEAVFSVTQHAFEDAVRKGYCDPQYNPIMLER